jgi:hypothetical protein
MKKLFGVCLKGSLLGIHLLGAVDAFAICEKNCLAIYDPTQDSWSASAPAPVSGFMQSWTLGALKDGRVLVVDRLFTGIYSPKSNTWKTITAPPAIGPSAWLSRTLDSGRVLLVEVGYKANQGSSQVFIFDPTNERWTKQKPMNFPRSGFNLRKTSDGRVIAYGGTLSSEASEGEIFDERTGEWEVFSSPLERRDAPMSVLLGNGSVLYFGGYHKSANRTLKSGGIFSPITREWTKIPDMMIPRNWASIHVLPDGRILVGGGVSAYNPKPGSSGGFVPTNKCEIYNPLTGRWVSTGSLNQASAVGIEMPFLGHRPLVFSDEYFGASRSEVYDVGAGQWRLGSPRPFHTQTVQMKQLTDGRYVMGVLGAVGR